MNYTIDMQTVLLPSVKKEVARVASLSYTEDGASEYDYMRITSKDEATVEESCRRAVNVLVAKIGSCATFFGKDEVCFSLPDFNVAQTEVAEQAITMYITLYACAEWYAQHDAKIAERESPRVEAALAQAMNVLLTRLKPGAIVLEANKRQLSFGSSASSQSIRVFSNGAWKTDEGAAPGILFTTVSPTSGGGVGTITVTVSANSTGEERTDRFWIKSTSTDDNPIRIDIIQSA